jgi:hypothetical protein
LKSSGRLSFNYLSCLFILLGLSTAVVLFLGGFAYDTLYGKHLRAEERWAQLKPYHYIYTIEIHSSFWDHRFQIEILNNGFLGMINLESGEPAELWKMEPNSFLHTTNELMEYLVIDGVFRLIHQAIHPPYNAQSFLARANPNLYYSLAMKGVLPFDWQGCNPAYPRVRYDAEIGFPRQVYLYGQPCSSVIDLHMPISLVIQDFTKLP